LVPLINPRFAAIIDSPVSVITVTGKYSLRTRHFHRAKKLSSHNILSREMPILLEENPGSVTIVNRKDFRRSLFK
jgi:hypothetical protein